MNTRWRRQVRLLKKDITRSMMVSAYGAWVEAVCGSYSTSEIIGVEGVIKRGENANDNLNDIYEKLEKIIPESKLDEIGSQRFFVSFAVFIGELDLGSDWHV